MAFFEWSAALSVGLETVDRQHKMLIGYINELDAAVASGKGHLVTRQIIANLRNYTRVHFAFEEGMFKVYRYEETADHTAGHHAFVDMIQRFEARSLAADAQVAADLLDYLKRWLTDHILVEDKAYSAVMIERGAK